MSTLHAITEVVAWTVSALPPQPDQGSGGGIFGTINDLNTEADTTIKLVGTTAVSGIFVWRAIASGMAAAKLIVGALLVGFFLFTLWNMDFFKDQTGETVKGLGEQSVVIEAPNSAPTQLSVEGS